MTKLRIQKRLFVLLAVGPAFAGYMLFTLYPNLMSAYYSLLDWNGISSARFIGLSNFKRMFGDEYMWAALRHSLIYAVTVPLLILVISLFLAYLLTNRGYRESAFYKVLFFFPNVLPMVVIALIWAFIYDGNFGLLNSVLKGLTFDYDGYYWLGDEKIAFWALIPPQVWGGVGFYLIIFMNAMIAIPKSLYESAILDGATHFQRLTVITLPLMNGIIRVCLLFMVLGIFKTIDIVLILTNGGPAGSTDVIGLYMFNLSFGKGVAGGGMHTYGYASAIGMFLFVILVGAKLLIDKLIPNKQVEF
ncbi:carbohydrate ABC transporter permease [Cohnella silvisoli]|uniref:Sugar ABC transporter permease n=1 Tax=Cohnella silvisoli TaxID=2873699 RepID=A0ABV1KUE3_9BACL|nr:sugar ABC transporter permease [Cohnella silvisoli]MCD9023152.1 sugar ABC transporter permease [Cohnella silvisoli]